MHTPGSEKYQHHLTPNEIATRFGPTKGQVNMVTAFLQAKGFTNIQVASNNLLVEADAPADIVSTALQTKFAKYTLEDGTSAYANTMPVTLPANLKGVVQDVLGLDTVTRVRTHYVQHQMATTNGSGVVTNATAGAVGHKPTEFPAIYNVSNTPAATNITIGIIAQGSMTQTLSDLATFTQQNGLPSVSTSVINTGTPSSDSTNTVEWDLDSQNIVAMAGGVKQLNFYVAPTLSWADIATAINRAVSDNAARVINVSLGGCESTAPRSSIDTFFQTAVAQGQTFVVSSGDTGSTAPGCSGTSVQYPASSPYVVAVGGTTLQTNTTGGYTSETAWSGSGGGMSTSETIPFWQSIASSMSGKSYRGLPDIAFDADPNSGALIVVKGQLSQVGGTSLSAPLFAATWGRMLSQCPKLGFAAPSLYAYRNLHSSMFSDITSGSNGAYSAAGNWDLVTGWGTPNINNMWATVCPTGAAYYAEVEQIYLGYLGRPIDPSGLSNMASYLQSNNAPTDIINLQSAYSTSSAVKSLIDGLQSSTESKSVYPTTNPSAYVTVLYQAIVNRSPTSTELSSLVNTINNGTLSNGDVALKIMATVRANTGTSSGLIDVITMQNKTAVAANFTATLTPSTAPYYSGTTAATSARHMLQSVSYSSNASVDLTYYNQPTYVSGFQSTINSTISNIVAGIPQ